MSSPLEPRLRQNTRRQISGNQKARNIFHITNQYLHLEALVGVLMSRMKRGIHKFLKYYDVLEWASRLILGLNAINNTDFIKKCF